MSPKTSAKDLLTGTLTRAVHFYSRSRWVLFGILLVLLAAYAASLLLSATSVYGIGVRSDSVAYIWSARNLAEGVGLGRLDGSGAFKPMTHWPPLYPAILALFPWFGVEVLEGARWLGAFLFGGNVLLFGWMLARITRSPWFAAAGVLVLLFSPAMAETSLQAMTEPLYIFLSLLALLFLEPAIRRAHLQLLAAAAVCTALALLTRYAGAALALTGVLAILIYSRASIRQRGRDLLVFLGIAILPTAVWALRNLLLSGSAANRVLTFYPILTADIFEVLATVQGWVSPAGTIFSIGAGKIILALGAVLGAFLLARFGDVEKSPETQPLLIDLNQILLGFYLVVVLISRLFFDPLITIFEQRILAPAYLSVLTILVGVLFTAWRSASARRWWVGAVLAIFYLWGAYSFVQIYRIQSTRLFNVMRENGSGYAYKGEMESAFAVLLRRIPDSALVFTSNVEKFYFLTGRAAYGYPAEMDAAFIRSVNEMSAAGGVFFVSFHRENESWRVIHEDLAGLQAVYEDENSLIYGNQPLVEG
ncbi:MAG: glycosyltransferase family 39 protein [Anaerolineaceae bacterium]|nr:glycosyltransferase family 39 protein [Anaerolineaceae bacterium]